MAITDSQTAVRIVPRDLPYAYDALQPQISEETLRYHHDKHYVGYVNKLNELIVDTPYAGQPLEDIVVSADGPIFNNAAQAWIVNLNTRRQFIGTAKPRSKGLPGRKQI